MTKSVSLALTGWTTLLDFVQAKLDEIAEFDDEDEEFVAVSAEVARIREQLGEDARRRV